MVKMEVWGVRYLNAAASSFVANIRGKIFTHFHAVAGKMSQ
jgi:hypothetical protein